MNEKEMFQKYTQVIVTTTQQGKIYFLPLTPVEVTALHGAVVLTMKHPEVHKKLKGAHITLTGIRKKILRLMGEMGFTPQEVEWLDKKEV